jgi:UDP-N-acetylmuramoyl-tripeptide--D-alanyl-D-alanine ligase
MAIRPAVLTLEHLLKALGLSEGQLPATILPQVEIGSAVIDSRLASPGCLFIALRGERHDGHDFVGEAIAKGAVAIIAEQKPSARCMAVLAGAGGAEVEQQSRDAAVSGEGLGLPLCLIVPDSLSALQQVAAYWRRQQQVRVIGITGSVGKTTSKEVIAAVLSQRFCTLKSEGNYNNEIGLPLTLLSLRARHERVVLEMGMYDLGEIAQLAKISLPLVGVINNVGPTHLERLATIERIAQAKAELAQALPAADKGGVAVLNADDPWVRAMSSQTEARVFTYGLDVEADLWVDNIESEGLEGLRFRFHHGKEIIHARVPMLGRHSVHTALRAASVGLVEGLSWEEIMHGLRDQAAQLRLVAVPGPKGSTILDDTYNASPASCIAALNLLEELGERDGGGRKIAVLGDMYELGSYEEEGHKIVGRRARDAADILVAVGHLGRMIGEEALKVGMPAASVHLVKTNAQAVDLLRALIEPGPVGDKILVKGSRGMAMEEIVAALHEGGAL